MIKLFTDAATKDNPGPTGLGAVILIDGQQIQLTDHATNVSNHTGEFWPPNLDFTT